MQGQNLGNIMRWLMKKLKMLSGKIKIVMSSEDSSGLYLILNSKKSVYAILPLKKYIR